MTCTFIASTLMWDSKKDGPNPLVKEAQKINIDGEGGGDEEGEWVETAEVTDERGEITGYIDTVKPQPIDTLKAVDDGSGRLEFAGVPVNTGEPGTDTSGINPAEGTAEALSFITAPR